jgi:ankyrin repeat protein
VDVLDIDCMSPLMYAAKSGHTHVCEALLEAGAVAKREDALGRHALSLAMEVGASLYRYAWRFFDG